MLIICAILVLLPVTIMAILLFIHCVCLVQLCDKLLAPAARHSIGIEVTMDSQMNYNQMFKACNRTCNATRHSHIDHACAQTKDVNHSMLVGFLFS